ncbi:terminase [Citrobacter portucalensis]|uniref:terminase n=1 Tax=Citrobacter portucalensis TaxID=1639133 RepID=UPI00226B85C9|nr:terminase [Citrobacter portucalensis]MCX8980105.1 terminase [Citrobacter portucalensis]
MAATSPRRNAGKHKRRVVTQDPRWAEFVKKYRYNWGEACVELFGKIPSWQQDEIIEAVQQTKSMTAVTSGHGTGKSDLTSMMIILFMICFPDSRSILVANKIAQVMTGVFKYLKLNWATCCQRVPWLAQYFVLTDTQFYERSRKGIWCVIPKGFRLGNEEALAGEHADYLMYIVDEASGVSDKAFGIITGALTQRDNRLLMLSQPTRPSGYFYDAHHKLAKNEHNPEGIFKSIVLNSEESPWVTPDFIKMKLAEYGGRDSVEYQIKVLGRFPDNINGFLLGRDECERAQRRVIPLHKGWGWVALFDVGNGRDKSILNIGRISGQREKRRYVPWLVKEMPGDCDPITFGDWIHQECDPIMYPNITLAGDSDGVGYDTCTQLERHGRNVQRIRWGKTMFGVDDKKRFINKRAFANIWARDAIKQGRMRLDKNSKTVEQASKIPGALNEAGQWAMMKKELMRSKLNIPSPDRWDTYCFAALVEYVPADMEMDFDKAERRADALKHLNDFDDMEEAAAN